jgi:hypothetical protein
MAMTVKTMAKRGNKRMRKNRSRAETVAWPLMGGPKRKKDLEATVLERFAMGAALAGDLAKRMADAKLAPEDGRVFLVISSPDFKHSGAYSIDPGHEDDWNGLLNALQQFVEKLRARYQKWWNLSWPDGKNAEKHAGMMLAAAHVENQANMIGLVICIRDREKKQWIVFSRPFVVSIPAAVELLETIVAEIRHNAESNKIA